MRVLIVGCGYVGLPLGAALIKQGHEVFGLRRSDSAMPALRAAGIEPLIGDVTRSSDLACLPTGWDWVVNLVASSHGGAVEYRAVYLEGSRNLLECLVAAPPRKFVYTSSTSVYAQNDGSTVDEQSPAEPAVQTAKVLLETERLLLHAPKQFPAVLLRVAGIYGPGRGYWFQQFLKSQAVIEGGGQRTLNMIHRDDLVGAIIAALHNGQPGQIYNAVDDQPVSQLDFFRWLSSQLGRPMPPDDAAAPHQQPKRGLTNKKVSNRRLKEELGYRFKYPTFREGYAAAILTLRESLKAAR